MSSYELKLAIEKRACAYDLICKRAEPLIRGDVTREQAIVKVMREYPQLYESYCVEERRVQLARRADLAGGNFFSLAFSSRVVS